MIVQYCIDWDALRKQVEGLPPAQIASQLLALSAVVRRNGCLIRSRYVHIQLGQWTSDSSNAKELSMALEVFSALYASHSFDVDLSSGADTLNDTIRAWETELRRTGAVFCYGDERCILVGGVKKGRFHSVMSLDEIQTEKETLADRWSRLQVFSGTADRVAFEKYMAAFSATADGTVRLYDPYLMDAFLPVRGNRRVKAWRNSLLYIMRMLAGNDRIDHLEIITSYTRDCRGEIGNQRRLAFSEVVGDLIAPTCARRSNPLTVSFHMMRERASFHDRFASNGRGCFSIGSGFDICQAEQGLNEWAWRNVPLQENLELDCFNVFFGAMRDTAPRGVTVFLEGKGWSARNQRVPMYPAGCLASSFDGHQMAEWFEMGTYGIQNPVIVSDRLTVNFNYFTDDF